MHLCEEAGNHRAGFFTEAWCVLLVYPIALLWNLKAKLLFFIPPDFKQWAWCVLCPFSKKLGEMGYVTLMSQSIPPIKITFLSFTSLDVSAT